MSIHCGDTAILNERVGKCESLVELREILNGNNQYHYEWKQYINRLVEKNHVNYTQMAVLCHSSRNTVKKWCREGVVPQNRQTFLKIALGFRMDLEEADELLQYYGKYPKLYAKTMEDAICIFLLCHSKEETGDLYEIYRNIHAVLTDKLREKPEKEKVLKRIDTVLFEGGIRSQKTLEDFETFLLEHYDLFQTSFQKLLDFIELFIKMKEENIHRFSERNKLDFSYEKMLSQLKRHNGYPDRLRLILLGVHLNMSVEYINMMLSLAHMAPMCAKDNLECVIMYVVESAYVNNPAYTIESAMVLKYYEESPQLQKRCQEILENYWKTDKEYQAGVLNDKNNLFEENISSYLKEVLEQLQWENDIFRYL